MKDFLIKKLARPSTTFGGAIPLIIFLRRSQIYGYCGRKQKQHLPANVRNFGAEQQVFIAIGNYTGGCRVRPIITLIS